MAEIVLSARDLLVRRGERVCLDVAALEVGAASMVAVSGPSGAGKTTLLAFLGGLLPPTAGSVTLAGAHAGAWPRSRTWCGIVLQSLALVGSLTAAENVAVPLRRAGVAPRDASVAATRTLERLGVAALADRRIDELSGGQVQRVSLARALAPEPDVLLLDEPTSELDEATRDEVLTELRAEVSRGAAVLLTTHDPGVAGTAEQHRSLHDGVLS